MARTKEELAEAKALLDTLKEIQKVNGDLESMSTRQHEVAARLHDEHKSIAQALEEEKDKIATITAALEKQTLVRGTNVDHLENEADLLETSRNSLAAQSMSMVNINKRHEEKKLLNEAELEVLQKQAQILEIQLADQQKIVDSTEEGTAEHTTALTELQKLANQLKDNKKEQKEINETTEENNKLLEGQEKIVAKISSAAGRLLSKIISVGVEAFNVEKQFERTYQMPPEYTQQLTALHSQMAATGVSMKDLAEGTGALINNVTEFTMATDAQRKALQEQTAQLGKLGIAHDDLGKGVQISMKMFGQSIGEATRTSGELAATARELGVAPGVMAAEYASMGAQLAKFGKEGTQTFKELARIQKLTGFEMSKVIQIASKFDTFEDAATATGKLNAALGGNFVNAMDMMMDTDPASRFDTIRSAIEDAGLSFDTMSYYQKQFYTEALGLSDVGDLALMLSGRTDLMTNATNASSESYEKQAERTQAVMNITEQFQAIVAANSEEIIELMHSIHGIVAGLTSLAGYLKLILPVLLAAKAGFWGFGISMQMVNAGLATSVSKWWIIIPAVLAFGAAVWLLTRNMKIESPSLVVIELLALGAAMWLLGKILPPVAPGLSAAGWALMTFGAGLFTVLAPIALLVGSMGLLAAGIGYMAEGIAKMFTAIDIDKMGALGKFIASIGFGGPLLVLGAIGLLAFSAATAAFGIALRFVSEKKLTSLATIMESMASIAGGSLKESADSLKSITAALDDVDKINTVDAMGAAFERLGKSVSSAVTPMNQLAAAMGSLTTEEWSTPPLAIEKTSEAINELPVMKTMVLTAGYGAMALAATSMAPIAMAFAVGAGATTAAGGLMRGTAGQTAANASGAGGGARTEPIQVIVEVDGDIFKKKVERVMGEYHKGG